ncbi:MAG: alcohol dehydrogenase, partial [Acidimicrobiales bacterium]
RFTFPSNRDRHLRAAHLISGQALASDAGERALPDVLTSLMKDIEMPNGIGAFGYRSTDIDMLVEGTMKQSRQLSVVPRKLTEKAARTIFEESMENW